MTEIPAAATAMVFLLLAFGIDPTGLSCVGPDDFGVWLALSFKGDAVAAGVEEIGTSGGVEGVGAGVEFVDGCSTAGAGCDGIGSGCFGVSEAGWSGDFGSGVSDCG